MTRAHDAVLFDLDDTLLDWSNARVDWVAEYARLLAPVHAMLHPSDGPAGVATLSADSELEEFSTVVREASMAEWRRAKIDHAAPSLERALTSAISGLGHDPATWNVEDAMRAFAAGWRRIPGVELFPDALDVLDALTERGYRLGLVTNAMQPMWVRDLELVDTGLIERLPFRISAADAGYIKPHRAIYEQAVAALGVEASRTVFVGDRPSNDVAGANAMGMTSVLMRLTYIEHPLDGHHPDHQISALSELLTLLD